MLQDNKAAVRTFVADSYTKTTNHITKFTQMFTATNEYSSQCNDVHPIFLDALVNRSTFAPVENH